MREGAPQGCHVLYGERSAPIPVPLVRQDVRSFSQDCLSEEHLDGIMSYPGALRTGRRFAARARSPAAPRRAQESRSGFPGRVRPLIIAPIAGRSA